MAKKYKPFATGFQYNDWNAKNCDSCKKGFNEKPIQGFRCDWERQLCVAFLHDGLVSEETARAIGYLDSEDCTIWECPGWERGRK